MRKVKWLIRFLKSFRVWRETILSTDRRTHEPLYKLRWLTLCSLVLLIGGCLLRLRRRPEGVKRGAEVSLPGTAGLGEVPGVSWTFGGPPAG
jgi:hypothetical protein